MMLCICMLLFSLTTVTVRANGGTLVVLTHLVWPSACGEPTLHSRQVCSGHSMELRAWTPVRLPEGPPDGMQRECVPVTGRTHLPNGSGKNGPTVLLRAPLSTPGPSLGTPPLKVPCHCPIPLSVHSDFGGAFGEQKHLSSALSGWLKCKNLENAKHCQEYREAVSVMVRA